MFLSYERVKGLIPKKCRLLLKPFYLRFGLRDFSVPQFVTVSDGNFSFFIFLDRQNGAVDEYIFMHKNWETEIGTVIQKELSLDGTFLDVGANIGYFSLLASRVVGDKGRVIAFEPISRLCQQIKMSVEKNNITNLQIENVGCSSDSGIAKLYLAKNNIGGSSLIAKKDSDYEEVVLRKLDDYFSVLDRIDLIKIDVEGREYDVLLGAKALLEKFKPKIILEFSPDIYFRQKNSHAKDILLFLKEYKYNIFDIDRKLIVENLDEYLSFYGNRQTNLLCVAI